MRPCQEFEPSEALFVRVMSAKHRLASAAAPGPRNETPIFAAAARQFARRQVRLALDSGATSRSATSAGSKRLTPLASRLLIDRGGKMHARAGFVRTVTLVALVGGALAAALPLGSYGDPPPWAPAHGWRWICKSILPMHCTNLSKAARRCSASATAFRRSSRQGSLG